MAKSRKQLREQLKQTYVEQLTEFFNNNSECVLRVGSNEIAFPITDEEGNEDYMVITCKIPIGSNKGTEPYDGFAMAEEYKMKCQAKIDKAKKSAEAKAKKIERDKIYRKKVAEMKKREE